MANTDLLITAMAEQCRSLISESDVHDLGLPNALQPQHLLWMCKQIEDHAEEGSITQQHRWIGFIQGGILANRMLDLDGLKAMFDDAKRANGEPCEDLIDHLDPTSSFEFDLGGEG